MPAIVTSSQIEHVVRQKLETEGYALSPARSLGENGGDIIAQRGAERVVVEAIAYKSSGSARAKDFYESFFRAISRLDTGATRVIVAVAEQARRGLPARVSQHRTGWRRIGAAFPELEIWIVDTLAGSIEIGKWAEYATA